MSGKKSQENLKIGLEIGTFVISVIALLISWRSSIKANEIAEQANQAKIILVNTLDVQRGYSKDLSEHICRSQIRVSNVGGVKTSLVSVGYKVRMNEFLEDFEISDYGNHGYLGEDILLMGYIWDETNAPKLDEIISDIIPESSIFKFPYEIGEHSTSDVFADLLIRVDPKKHKFLLWWLRTQPANPTYAKDYLEAPNISVEYSLKFSNGDNITTPALSCFFFKR